MSNDLFFDPFRKKWVKNRPEEHIRVSLLHKMVNELSYPLSLIAIEIELKTLPHLSSSDKKCIPKRRIDIVVFDKDIHPQYPLFPLFLIECKAVDLTDDFKSQVIGYNDIVKAPYIALANGTHVQTGRFDLESKAFQFVDGLPNYNLLK